MKGTLDPTVALILILLNPLILFAQEEASFRTAASFFDANHALIIGNSNYTNTAAWSILTGVERDVQEVKRVFLEQGFEVHLKQDVRSDSFRTVIEDFIDEYGSNRRNRIIIYYTGHGTDLPRGEGQSNIGYIVPVDSPSKADSLAFVTGAISMEEMVDYATYRVVARHALFIFDSCFSGAVLGELADREVPAQEELERSRGEASVPPYILEALRQPVRQFIVSSTANQEVSDDSAFRQRLVAILESKINKFTYDRYITGKELGGDLEREVADATAMSRYPQNPQSRFLNPNELTGDFIFDSKAVLILEGKNPGGPAFSLDRDPIPRRAGKQNKISNHNWGIVGDSLFEITLDLHGWRMRKFDLEISFVDSDSVQNKIYTIEEPYLSGATKIRQGIGKKIYWDFRQDLSRVGHILNGRTGKLQLQRKENWLFYPVAISVPTAILAGTCIALTNCPSAPKDDIANPPLIR